MAKVCLHDDPLPTCPDDGPHQALAGDRTAGGVLADDISVDVNPTILVRQPGRTGYDVDGNPVYGWTDVVDGPAIFWEASEAIAEGRIRRDAKAVVLYDGDVEVNEHATVHVDGTLWATRTVSQYVDRIELELRCQQ